MPLVANPRGEYIAERKEGLRYSEMELTTSTVTKNTTSTHRGRAQREEAGADRADRRATDSGGDS